VSEIIIVYEEEVEEDDGFGTVRVKVKKQYTFELPYDCLYQKLKNGEKFYNIQHPTMAFKGMNKQCTNLVENISIGFHYHRPDPDAKDKK
jgi:hypothetical protein